MKIKCMHIGNIVGGEGYTKYEMSNIVYSEQGLCPTLPARYDHGVTGFKIVVYETKTNSRNEKKSKK